MEKKQYNEILNNILLSKNVKKNFVEQYKDRNFASYLDMIFPEIEECIECTVHTLDGTYNLMEQILTNVEEMNKLTSGMDSETRRKFAFAIFVKDVVKVNYQQVHYENGKRNDVFPYYTWSSESVAGRALPTYDFTEKEIFEIKKVLRYADMFDKLNTTSKKILPEFVQEAVEMLNEFGDGEEFFNKIILLNTAECKAFNNNASKEKLEVLKKAGELLVECSNQKQ